MSDTGLWRKMLDFFGFDEDEEDEPEDRDEHIEESAVDFASNKRPQQIVDIRQRQQMKVVVVQPRNFEEVQGIVEHIKARRPLILNLDVCEVKARQRVLDFMSGATYGSGGRMQKISECIFLSAPSNIQIDNVTGEIFEEDPTGKRISLNKKGN